MEGSFRLFALPEGAFDLTTAKITAKGTTKPVAKQDYTGREIRPEIDVLAKQKGSSQYTKVPSENVIISFRDNVRRGKAIVIVTGDNVKAFGCRTGNFTIGIKSFKDILAIVFDR